MAIVNLQPHLSSLQVLPSLLTVSFVFVTFPISGDLEVVEMTDVGLLVTDTTPPATGTTLLVVRLVVGRRIGRIVVAVALIGVIGALVETIVGRCTAVPAEIGFCAGTTLLVGFFVLKLIRESRAWSLNEGATTPGISWQHTPTNLSIKSCNVCCSRRKKNDYSVLMKHTCFRYVEYEFKISG